MAKYIFRCIDNRLYACNVGDYCTGHSWYGDDGYTNDIVLATVYDETVKKDADEIDAIDFDCAGCFEKIEVPMCEKTKQQEIAEFEKWYKEWKSNNDTTPFSTCSIKDRMMIAFIAGMSAQ